MNKNTFFGQLFFILFVKTKNDFMKFILFLLLSFPVSNCFSQNSSLKPNDSKLILSYSKLNKVDFEHKLLLMNKEIYKDCMNYLSTYEDLNRDVLARTSIYELKSGEVSNIKNISEIFIKSKCNNALNHNSLKERFSIETFNPLLYSFDLNNSQSQTFRIYNTNYILEVSGKK
jgi:hypothetical protein